MQKVIQIDLDGQEIKLIISRATALTGMRRSIMAVHGAEEVRENQDEAVRVLRTITYPDLTACTVAEGLPNPVPFEDFLALPDDFIGLWEQAVYEVNPHWNPAGMTEAQQEKKV